MTKLVAWLTGAALVGVAAVGAPGVVRAASSVDVGVSNAAVDLSSAKKARKSKARRHVRVYRRYPRSTHVYVAPGPRYAYPAPGGDYGYPFDPRRVGPGGAYQGNIPGCAVDLGYGRWEPCGIRR